MNPKFEKMLKQLDKDCPMHDCWRYNSQLRGGCMLGTKRRNCWAYEAKEKRKEKAEERID